MDAQELRNLQEAYIEVYQNLDEEGATSKRLADVADDRIGDLPRTHHIHHRRGTASLRTLSNLHFNAKERAQGRYPEKSGLRRGAGGAGVPDRPGDSVTSLGDTRRGAARKLLDLEANRKKPLTPSERPIPIRSRPTPPTSGPTSRTNTPLTPKIRDQRAAAAGFSGQGSLPKGPKLARQTARGVTTGDDPMKVLQSAAQQKEHYDLYDIILSHLLDEGYAETVEAAEVMMVNMSEEWRENIMIAEGMTMKDFKANRRKNKRRDASADAVKRGHVGKEWYNSGRRYSPDEAKRMRSNLDDEERRTRHRSAVDPDNENDDNFSADKTKNPKKLRKQKAMGEH